MLTTVIQYKTKSLKNKKKQISNFKKKLRKVVFTVMWIECRRTETVQYLVCVCCGEGDVSH